MSFNNLRKKNVKHDVSVEYKLVQLEGEPVLLVRPATEVNKPFFNAVLKRGQTSLRRLRAGQFSAEMVAANREEDRALYPKHIVTGWAKVKEDTGVDAAFSKEACAEFITALPDWIFDDLRDFCGNPSNFVGLEEVQLEDESRGN